MCGERGGHVGRRRDGRGTCPRRVREASVRD